MTRQRKTPRQRAEETLAIAQRRVIRLRKEATRRREELEHLEAELRHANARLDYAKQDPALQNPNTSDQAGDPTT